MIYLDNAATTYPKPRSVLRAAVNAIKYSGGNPGRSGHRLSRLAGREIFACREHIASLFGGKEENTVLTLNATYAINLAITALCDRGKPIAISNIEHNAVYRPALAHPSGHRVFDVLHGQEKALHELENLINEGVGTVICCHTCNICGATSPIAEIGKLCRKRNIRFIVDASQSAGVLPINMSKIPADAICAPSHKGLYGLQGCGFVLFADKYSDGALQLAEFIRGGSGALSLEPHMPIFLPERYEAGTLPTPAAASLAEGIKFVRSVGIAEISEHEKRLSKQLFCGLKNIEGAEVYGEGNIGSAVLFNLTGMSSERVAEALDSVNIAVRAGYHCAPLAHRSLGVPSGGAVRASFSVFNNKADVDALLMGVLRIRR